MKKKVLSGVLYSAAKAFGLALVLTALLFSTIGVGPARAATSWTVTSFADDGTAVTGNCPGADCRLRDALAAAAADDTIVFAAGLSGQIIRVVSTLTISKNVIINGSALASKITISGDTDNDGTGNVRVFYIDSGLTVTINSLKIMKGLAIGSGGAIYNYYSTVTIRNSIFLSNASNGSNNGGAIRNYGGILTVIDSTFTNNSASYHGGAIHSEGTLLVKSSTFSNNSANSYGGAILGNGTIVNSTFYGNYADKGGAIYGGYGGSLTVKNSTFSNNIATDGYGGGIYNTGGTIHFANNIITNSTGTDCRYSGTFITNTNNLIRDGSCLASYSGDPKLAPLASNGGPTQTMALLAGSPAVNAGNDAICAADPVNNLDQRGVVRPRGGHCDIGAFETPFNIGTYLSDSTQDGWVLESNENSSVGLTMSNAAGLLVGDDGARRQYRTVLSFNTSGLPDTAVINSVVLKIKQQSVVGAGNPVGLLQGFMVDVKTGMFGVATLEAADFQTAANATYGPFAAALSSTSWYSIDITTSKALINKVTTNNGLTQIRLRFKLDDDNNAIANYLTLFSGGAGVAGAPQLVIQYTVP